MEVDAVFRNQMLHCFLDNYRASHQLAMRSHHDVRTHVFAHRRQLVFIALNDQQFC